MGEKNLKQEAIELLQKVDNEHALFLIYGTIKAAYMEQGTIQQGVIDDLR